MSFSSDWLALREPFDLDARNTRVLAAVVAAMAEQPSVNIVDLACGTGSTLRALAPRIAVPQRWRLADNDLGLLLRASTTERPDRVQLDTAPIDLARDLEAALDGVVDLVTSSALIDLVSAEWLERLAIETVVRSAPLYVALSYDGRIEFEPQDAADDIVVAAVNAHQHTDKGFGPALGPDAAATLIARLEALDYAVIQGPSDWRIGPNDREMQMQLLAGWAQAVGELGDVAPSELDGWLTRRRDAVSGGRSSMMVGHVDLFARPIGTRHADRSQSSSKSLPS
jgi:hypothetical protein